VKTTHSNDSLLLRDTQSITLADCLIRENLFQHFISKHLKQNQPAAGIQTLKVLQFYKAVFTADTSVTKTKKQQAHNLKAGRNEDAGLVSSPAA